MANRYRRQSFGATPKTTVWIQMLTELDGGCTELFFATVAINKRPRHDVRYATTARNWNVTAEKTAPYVNGIDKWNGQKIFKNIGADTSRRNVDAFSRRFEGNKIFATITLWPIARPNSGARKRYTYRSGRVEGKLVDVSQTFRFYLQVIYVGHTRELLHCVRNVRFIISTTPNSRYYFRF